MNGFMMHDSSTFAIQEPMFFLGKHWALHIVYITCSYTLEI